jgi:hypothetical protein
MIDDSEAAPPLRPLHPGAYDSGLAKLSLGYWKQQPTEKIIETLKPGAREVLRVFPDGLIANGNTRIKVLIERGMNVDALPREVYHPDSPKDSSG